VGEDSLWILERATTTSKMESQNASIATNMATWRRNVRRKKRRKHRNISNVTKKSISPRTVKKNSQ